MVLTNAERQAIWRQRQRENVTAHSEYKRKERERYQKKKEKGVIKSVNEMTTREQRTKRKQWRNGQRTKRARDRNILAVARNTMTPPTSPDTPRYEAQQQVAHAAGRKKVRKDRAKAYREIFKLRVTLQKESRLKERYKKRSQRLKKKLSKGTKDEENRIIRNHDVRKAILFYHTIVENVKKRYHDTKSYKHRKYMSSLICSYDLVRKYRLGQYARKMLGLTCYQMKTGATEKNPLRKKTTTVKSTRIRASVSNFLERDDNSRMKADKKATVTKYKQKKQVRLLNDDLKHLYAKYMAEGQRKVSYSLFCKLRPFWIRSPTSKDRDTCQCKLHENLQFKLERAYYENMYPSKHIDNLAKTITCNNKLDNKECMYRDCIHCKDKNISLSNDDLEMGKQVTWKMWKTRKIEINTKNLDGAQETKVSNRVVKETEQGSLETLNSEANAEIKRICRHIFNIHQQYSAMKYLKENLNDNDLLLHIDFSENYNCKYNEEVQSVHFGASQRMVSIHTGIAYTNTETVPFATLSDNLKHGPGAIWAHLDPILKYMNSLKRIGKVHFLSDGPTTQYRNKHNLYLFSSRLLKMGFAEASWNFLEAGHGKGAADGVGAVIKRTADRMVVTNRHDITCATELARELETSTVKIFVVKGDDIDGVEKTIPSGVKPVPSTMRIHQVLVNKLNVIRSRELSCFCNYPEECMCYGLVETKFISDSNQEPTCMSRDTGNEQIPSVDDCDGQQAQNSPYMHEESSALHDMKLQKLVELDETLIGKYVVVKYDGLPYPGIVMDVDDTELEVKVMHKVGKNRFFWPHPIDDILWYNRNSVLTILQNEPQKVTGRHCQIDTETWKEIENALDL